MKPSVGVYYYPWYRAGWVRKTDWRRAMRLRLEHPQEPRIGLYDSRDPEVIAEHIRQSIRGGIAFWAVSWWGPGSYTDRTFRDDILKHPDAAKLKYAVLYESTGRMKSFTNPDYSKWMGDLEYIKKIQKGIE